MRWGRISDGKGKACRKNERATSKFGESSGVCSGVERGKRDRDGLLPALVTSLPIARYLSTVVGTARSKNEGTCVGR